MAISNPSFFYSWLVASSLLSCWQSGVAAEVPKKIGVLFAVHGGFERVSERASYDVGAQILSYFEGSIPQRVVANPLGRPWLLAFPTARFQKIKYEFEYARIGGVDPFDSITEAQRKNLEAALNEIGSTSGETEVHYAVETVSWIDGNDLRHHPDPKAMEANAILGAGYCGPMVNPWPNCNPNRYKIEGPTERLLNAGADEIILADLLVGGVRFSKTYDVLRWSQRAAQRWAKDNGKNPVTIRWANDPNRLMERSYPTKPERWHSIQGEPVEDPKVPLAENPNPIVRDKRLAELHAERISQAFHGDVPLEKTAVLFVDHGLIDGSEVYDPKIDDTTLLRANIETALRERYPELRSEHIRGGYFGHLTKNPRTGRMEMSRAMRGERLGYVALYETEGERPAGKWGEYVWDSLEKLKESGVEHIVVSFPQVVSDSVLNLVEVPNQIAREIGRAGWYPGEDQQRYPGIGHPFATHWGVWIPKQAGQCFQLGGCGSGSPYPPKRTTPGFLPLSEGDPSLAFDVSAYGELGYDPSLGPVDGGRPVQRQYRGTWTMASPINADPTLSQILADQIVAVSVQQ